MRAPQVEPFVGLGQAEVEQHVEAAQEGTVDSVERVGRDQHQAAVGFEPLQQEVGLEVGVAVVGVADQRPAGEQSVTLVEQQQHVECLGGGK